VTTELATRPVASGRVSSRPACPADLPAIIELLGLCLGEGGIPRTEGWWRWKHEANPFGPSPVLVAEADGRIVGLRAFMRWLWRAGDRVVPAIRAVDTATHPAYRGQGIFTDLTRNLLDVVRAEAEFVYNTPNRRSGPGYLKMGWVDHGRVTVSVRARRPFRMLRSLSNGAGRTASPVEDDTPVIEGRRVRDLLAAPCLETFLSPGTGARYETPRDPGYLRWRYVDIPGFRYHATWEAGRRSAAAVIWRIKRRGDLRELRVVELLVGEGRAAVGHATGLIRGVVRASGCDYASAMTAPSTPERTALRRAGFLTVPGLGPRLVVRALGTGIPPDRAAWRFSIGDLEIF